MTKNALTKRRGFTRSEHQLIKRLIRKAGIRLLRHDELLNKTGRAYLCLGGAIVNAFYNGNYKV